MSRVAISAQYIFFNLRRLHHPLRGDADCGGDASALAGAWSGSEAQGWSCWSLETGEIQLQLQLQLELQLQIAEKF